MVDRPRRASQLTRVPPTGAGREGAGVILGRRATGTRQRAVIGGFLVAVAVVIVFAAVLSTSGHHMTPYEVAAAPLPAGTTIGAADLTTTRMDLGGSPRSSAFQTPSALLGRTLAVAVPPGALIQSSMLVAPTGSTLRPVSISVDANSLSDLATGQAVDVLDAPSSTTTGTASAVTVVMRGATLLSVHHSDSGLLSSSSNGSTVVVTLGVANLTEAEQLVSAERTGTVELIQAEPSDGTGPGGG